MIEKIQIKNFRSIHEMEFSLKGMTLLIGDNDAGKSNVLRALSLFFNGAGDPGTNFSFAKEFNSSARVPQRKAKEIVITIFLSAPTTYQSTGELKWRKVWRLTGLHEDTKTYSDGTPFEKRSRLSAWLQSMQFKYVPAIKSPDYFSRLLADLHDTLTNTVAAEIRTAAKTFTKSINRHTNRVTKEINTKLGFASTIELPDDLRALFTTLEFRAEETGRSLDQRGDGIKVRHVPILLKYMADQANENRPSGTPVVSTVWGYEEPENNLELSRAITLGKELLDYSRDIQLIVTTHSPAIYGLSDDLLAKFYIEKDGAESGTVISECGSMTELDQKFGLMPLVAPYLQELQNQREELKRRLAEISASEELAHIFVEGPSDKEIVLAAIRRIAPELEAMLAIKCAEKNGGGSNWVRDMAFAWMHSRRPQKAIALFDVDFDAEKCHQAIIQSSLYKRGNLVSIKIPPSNVVRTLKEKGIVLPNYAIESLVPSASWVEAENQGWLIEKSGWKKLILDHIPGEGSISDALTLLQLTTNESRFLKYEINSSSKEKFSKLAVAKIAALTNDHLKGKTALEHLISTIGKKISSAAHID